MKRLCGHQHTASQRTELTRQIAQKLMTSSVANRVKAKDLTKVIRVKVRFIVMTNYASQQSLEADINWNLAQINKYYANATQNIRKNLQAQQQILYNGIQRTIVNSAIQFVLDSVVYDPKPAVQSPSNVDFMDYVNSNLKLHGTGAALNVWVLDFGSQADLLGYGIFPNDTSLPLAKHGVVLNHRTFVQSQLYSEYNLSGTLAHEIGHSAGGLLHTFQSTVTDADIPIVDMNGNARADTGELTGDMIDDTPYQRDPTYGDPSKTGLPTTIVQGKRVAVCSVSLMDYVDDGFMTGITNQQALRARLVLLSLRASWLQ